MSSQYKDVNVQVIVNNYKIIAAQYTNADKKSPAVLQLDKKNTLAPAQNFSVQVGDDRVIMNWEPVQHATSYELERALDPTFINELSTVYSGPVSQYTDMGLIGGTDYYYRLTGVSNDYNPNFTSVHARTLFNLAKSTPFSITNVYDTSVQLSWPRVMNATGYIVEESTLSDFSSGVTNVYTGNLLTSLISGLTPSNQYYFRLHPTANGYNVFEYSNTNTTTAASLPAPTSLTSSNVATTSMTITWAAVSGANTYMLERSTASDFSTGLTTVYNGNLLTYGDAGLITATTYYYRVHAVKTGFTTITYRILTQATN